MEDLKSEKNRSGSQLNQIRPIKATWAQLGKGAFVFAMATGAYVVATAVGNFFGADSNTIAANDSQMNTALVKPADVFSLPSFSQAVYPIDTHSIEGIEDGNNAGLVTVEITNDEISSILALSTLIIAYRQYPSSALSSFGLSLLSQLSITDAAFPSTIELATLDSVQGQGVVVQGEVDAGHVGISLSDTGDVNNDGVDDFLVGAWNVGGTGAVYLIFGRNGTWPAVLDLTNFNGTQGVRIQGVDDGDKTGVSVSGGGDMNNDGLPDCLISANHADSTTGEAYYLFGHNRTAWANNLDLAGLTGMAGVLIQTSAGGGYFGTSVASVGDVNGDGIDDMLIGAYAASPSGRSEAGVAYLIFGRSSWSGPVEVPGSQAVMIEGILSNDETGYSVANAGDVNGDGISDLLIGAYQAPFQTRTEAGAVYVVFGQSGTWSNNSLDLELLTVDLGMTIHGAVAGDKAGISVSGAGDVNGDGIDDLVLGAFRASPLGRNESGSAYLIFGQNGTLPPSIDLASLNSNLGVEIQGASMGIHTGVSVSGVGDVNGDGLDDVLIGANLADSPQGRSRAGAAYLIYGRNGTWPEILDLSRFDSTVGVLIEGAAAFEQAGYAVSGAGDVNGDGLADLLIGADEATFSGRDNAGKVYLIFGQQGDTLATTRTPTPTMTSIASNVATSQTLSFSQSSTPIVSASSTFQLSSALSTSSSANPTSPTLSSASNTSRLSTQVLSTATVSSSDSNGINVPGFTVVSSTTINIEIGVETTLTTDNLSVNGLNVDPNLFVFTLNGDQPVTILVNGVVSDEFTLFDLQSGDVDLYIDTASCEDDLSTLDLTASDGARINEFSLVMDARYNSCTWNAADRLNEQHSLKTAAALLVTSGLGLLATSKKHEKNKVTKGRGSQTGFLRV